MKNLLLLLLLFTGIVNAQIVNIPDASFKSRLITNGADLNDDNEIQVSEALAITNLDISNQFANYPIVNDLTGIESFTNLINIDCRNNQIVVLDVSSLTNLQTINCSYNAISNLDVLNLPNLLSLNCAGNPITILNLANNLMLQSLNCGSRVGTTSFLNTLALPFPDNVIEEISVYQTNLTYINLLNYPLLRSFAWQNNNVNTFDFSNNAQLTSLNLGGSFASLDFSPLSNLQSINLSLDNDIALDFSPLVALKSFSIAGLSTEFTILDLNNSPLLESLIIQGTSISTLDISNCNLLDYIFFNLVSNITSLDLSNFQNLESVYLRNMTLSNLNLKNGGQLTEAAFFTTNINYICSNTSDIQLLNDALAFPSTNNFISNVNSYCSFSPGGAYNNINGITLFDANGNGCDVNDALHPNIKIKISDGIAEGATFTNNTGNYNYFTQAGGFDITPDVENPTWFDFFPTTASTFFADTNNNTATQNFCISPNGIHNDLEVVISPIILARPGFDATYKIVYKNKGNQIISGTVTFGFDDSVLDFISSTVIPNSQTNGLLTFDYTNLLPFESRSFEIVLNVNAPTETPAVNNGDILNFSTAITPIVGDELPNDNQFAFNQVAVGSYDPNQIICLEGDSVSPDLIGKFLHYSINFENLGTFYAENVVVRCEIDPLKYDITTLQLMSSSHPSFTKIIGNVVEFIFEHIKLEAIYGDPPVGGHGDVLFKIKSKNDLIVNDSVIQKADIYFDYNFPIVTNDAETTFATLSNVSFEQDVSVKTYPNPTSAIITIESKFKINTVELYDVQGRILETHFEHTNSAKIDITKQSNGIYFLKIKTDRGIKVEKILKK